MSSFHVTHSSPDWLQLPGIRRITELYAKAGMRLCFYGGAVRDGLMGLAPTDFDCYASGSKEENIALLKGANLKVRESPHESHKLKITSDGLEIDIFCTRKTAASNDEFAEVSITRFIQHDFTINRLFITPEGNIHDAFGGMDDIKTKKLTITGDPEEYFRVYHHRMVRLFRFLSQIGNNMPRLAEYLAICDKHRAAIYADSRAAFSDYAHLQTRIMLTGDYLPDALAAAQTHGFTGRLFAELHVDHRIIAHLQRAEAHLGQAPDYRVRLAALMLGTGAPLENARKLFMQWAISDADTLRVVRLIEHAQIAANMPIASGDFEKILRVLGKAEFEKLLALGMALALRERDFDDVKAGYLNAQLSLSLAL